ncbi:hypothetical protein B0G69_7140 [Paraburkholderia sp. RAU2J]|nr:hypothetical protein B0G69_7140 [Paraburkholderia sp. RAU2J]
MAARWDRFSLQHDGPIRRQRFVPQSAKFFIVVCDASYFGSPSIARCSYIT